MGIGVIVLDDFTGGIQDAKSSNDFGVNEWYRLYGVLLETNRTLRAQWALQLLDDRQIDSFGAFDGTMAYRVITENGPVWFGGGLPLDTATVAEFDAASFGENVMRLDSGQWDVNVWGGNISQ
jgi:hypothetical protein